MDARNVEDLIHHQIVMINLWEEPKRKKQIMPLEDTEEDDRVPLILGRPLLHTANAIIRVKNKELNLGIRENRATFLINKAMQHSHLNDDTCFRITVIDEVNEDELDALLNDSKPFLIVISSLLEQNEKEGLVLVLKNHKEAFAWKTSDNPGISPSFYKHKINFEDDVKPVIQREC
nr:reverse transcriptase domain-containing protein [Tanacetum cinerariifolium]